LNRRATISAQSRHDSAATAKKRFNIFFDSQSCAVALKCAAAGHVSHLSGIEIFVKTWQPTKNDAACDLPQSLARKNIHIFHRAKRRSLKFA